MDRRLSSHSKICYGIHGNVHLLRLEDFRLFGEFNGHTDQIREVVFSPDSRFLASAGDDHKAMVWDLLNEKRLRTYRGHAKEGRSVQFSPNGKFIATGGLFDKTARIRLVGENTDVSISSHLP